MKIFKKRIVVLLALFISTMLALAQEDTEDNSDFPVLTGPYLGQKPPGMTPEIFAPNIISIDGYEELCSGFMDDGKVFLFSRLNPIEDWKKKPTSWMVMKEGFWSRPIEVPFNDLHPHNFSIAPDGNTLYFTTIWSKAKPRKELEKTNLWEVHYIDGVWCDPEKLGMEINTDAHSENYPSVSQDGTIYYMKHDPNGYGKMDLVYHELIDNTYGKMMNMGAPVITQLNELDPFIAPDESFLIYIADYEDSRGTWDLYVSFKKDDDKWTEPLNMGDDINTGAWESRPYVTCDGKYLFFSRGDENPSWADIYWVDAKIIEELRPKE